MTLFWTEREQGDEGENLGRREKLAFGIEGMEFLLDVAKSGAHRGLWLPWFAASWENECRRFFCWDNEDVYVNDDDNPTTAPTGCDEKSSWCSDEKSSLKTLLRWWGSAWVECAGDVAVLITLSRVDYQRTHTFWELEPYEQLSSWPWLLLWCCRGEETLSWVLMLTLTI